MNLEALKTLNRNIADYWEPWVESAPHEWKTDDFITSNSPIARTYRYGQDELVDDTGDFEAEEWEKERCFENVRYVSFAIATDVE